MDLNKVLAHLRTELENLDSAILSLERLEQRTRRRGRPPLLPGDEKKPSRPGRAGRPRGSSDKSSD